jgi:two-component system, cell cycle sensor histidine kinase and response regulator CckA
MAEADPPRSGDAGRGLRTVKVPVAFEPLFLRAQEYVARYFGDLHTDPEHGTISISGERYILLRAASMSVEFFDLVMSLYQDKGPDEARRVASNLLFDVAHAIGKADARAFHQRMDVTDPIERLSAGPVHFSFAGWAFVDISPESHPSPDEDFFLIYDHPYSFESDTWLRRGRSSESPVCVMNAGYSSGWCEESFGLPLVAAEVECLAAGGKHCRFVMAPPSRIEACVARHLPAAASRKGPAARSVQVSVPEFFQRKRMEEELQRSHETLERRVDERTAELVRTNELLRREIAERRRAEEVRDEFLSVAAHELKTPLTSLRGFTQLVTRQIETRGKPDPETLGTALKAIDRQTTKLSLLVEQLLDISRLEAGRLVLDCEDTEVMGLARHVAEAAQASARRHSVSVSGPEQVAACVDSLRLEQVLTNLVDNAIKYSPDGGPVDVSVSEQDRMVRIAVTDSGLGIPEPHRQRIFDRFYQAHAEHRLGGMGLGLYISHQIVELHGGSLALEHPDGGGTRFVVTLPRDAPPRADP